MLSVISPVLIACASCLSAILPSSFFVVYVISSGATATNTVGAGVTGIAVDADDTVNGLPQSSTNTEIKAAGSGVPDTDTIHPSGDGGTANWTFANSADADLDTHDDDTTTADTKTNSSPLRLTLDAPSGSGTINTVTVFVVGKDTGTIDEGMDVGLWDTIGTFYAGGTGIQGFTASYATYSEVYTTRPWDSQPWTWTDIINLTIGGTADKGGAGFAGNIYVTEVFVVVNYTTGGAPTYPPITFGVTVNGRSDLTILKGSVVSLAATVDDTDGGAHNVTAAEWYIHSDPGAGSADTVDTFPPGVTVGVTNIVDTSGLSVGEHYIYVRGQDDGTIEWGNPSSAKITVYDSDEVTLSAADSAPAAATRGGQYSFMNLSFIVSNSKGDSTAVIDRIQVDLAGTAQATDVAQASIFDDSGSSAGAWDTDDVTIGSVTVSSSSFTIDVVNQTVTSAQAITLHAVLTIDASADTARTVGVTVDDSYILLVSPDTMVATASSTSGQLNIVASGGDGGITCGDCHQIPPQDPETDIKGTHASHASVQADCAKCHDTASASYTTSHPDGVVVLGFDGTAVQADARSAGEPVVYHDSG